jgi:hypothetical protein
MKWPYNDHPQVKSFQRSGEAQKELWWQYADTYLGAVRDPSKHDIASLRDFVTSNQLPPPAAAGMAPPVGGCDPAKAALVERIKAFGRVSKEQRGAWTEFCGPICDPARHETAKLEEFIYLHGVP